MTHREIITRVWPGWEIEKKIGEGSYGKVFKVSKESGGMVQESAVKVIRIPEDEEEFKLVQEKFSLTRQETEEYFQPEVERFKKEILIMKDLGEENNIVRILDFEIVKDTGGNYGWYILIRMELLESLDSLIKRRDFSIGDVLSLADDILNALKACEEHNILHRDIKPDNLFCNKYGRYKLGDFGIARKLKESSLSLSHRGTDNYMAPEIYQGKSYSHNADIYSLGIVLYKLLNNNRLPFLEQGKLTASSLENAFKKRQTGEKFPNPTHGSVKLFSIIEKMCVFDPKDRFQNAEEVLEQLREYRKNNEDELKKSLEIKRMDIPDYIINKKQASSTREETVLDSPKEKDIPEDIPLNEETNFDYTEGTRKLHPERKKAETNSSWDDIEEAINKMQEDSQNNKKSGFKTWLPIIAVSGLILVIGAAFLLRSKKTNEQANATTEETSVITSESTALESSEISEAPTANPVLADDVFSVDKSQLPEGSYLEYTTNLWIPSAKEVKERSGIYVGEQTDGVPNGIGGFFYQTEGQGEENSHYLVQNVYIGEWENGVLKPGTIVKQRKKNTLTYENGDIFTFTFRFEDTWDVNNFRDNMRGSMDYIAVKGETGQEEKQNFVGVFDKESAQKLNGTEYNDTQKYVGDYRDNRYFNGIIYNLEGAQIGTVTEGNVEYTQ